MIHCTSASRAKEAQGKNETMPKKAKKKKKK